MGKTRWCAGLVLACVGLQGVAAEATRHVPDRPEAELFKDVPAPWRDYLLQARRAEGIADPLQRCLAYPDLPGNQWPEGHGRAHCLDHAASAMSMADAAKLLEAGRPDALDAYLRGLEAKHARKVDPSEEIHYFFEQFAWKQADAFTAAWLKAQPDNPYALTARAYFHSGMAREARGGAWASETAPENLRRMTAEYDLALPLYRKAVHASPRFIVAWNGMLSLAYRDSRPELEDQAFRAADAIDPGCQDLADIRMTSLQPRWGGSYEAMLAYAEHLKPLMADRPILAREVAAPYGDRGDRMVASEERNGEAMDILDIAVRTGSNEGFLEDAANVAFNATDGSADPWKALGYLLQQARFKDGGWWANINIARMLVRQAPEVALRYAARAVDAKPDDAASHYYLAASHYNTGHFDAADTHYRIAMKDRDYLHSSLDEVIRMWMFDAGLTPKEGSAKAKPDVERLVREYPEDGRARMYRIQVEGALNRIIPDQLVADFEKRADAKDPRQAWFLKRLEEGRKKSVARPAGPPARVNK